MRKTYHTDLSDPEWARIEPNIPVPKAPGDLDSILHAKSSTPSSTSSAAGVLGAFCPTTSPLEDRPSLLQDLATRWGLGAAQRGAARALASTAGEKPAPQRRDGRLTVGQNDRG